MVKKDTWYDDIFTHKTRFKAGVTSFVHDCIYEFADEAAMDQTFLLNRRGVFYEPHYCHD